MTLRPARFDHRTGGYRRQSWRAQTKPCVHQNSGVKQRPHRSLNRNHLLVLEGLLWSHRSERPHHRDRGAGSSSPEDGPWHESSWRSPLSLPWSPQTQGLVSTGQKNTREGAQPHPSEDNWIKALLSKALPARARSTFSHCQSLPSGSLHKPLSLLHQKADRRITIPP